MPSKAHRLTATLADSCTDPAGKSSLLESIAGVALPRGTGLVTRCPLQLSLRSGPESASISYSDAANKHVTEEGLKHNEIADAIQRATQAISGTNNITDSLIALQVERPDAPTLTLIDLPGIVRVHVGKRTTTVACMKHVQHQESISELTCDALCLSTLIVTLMSVQLAL